MKRSQQRRFTKKAKVLRYMRLSRGISQAEAAKICGCSEAAIGHYENGRMDVSEKRWGSFLRAYRYEFKDLEILLSASNLPIFRLKDECVRLVV